MMFVIVLRVKFLIKSHEKFVKFQTSCFVSFEVENRSDIAIKYFFPTRFKNLYNLKNPSIQVSLIVKFQFFRSFCSLLISFYLF